MTTTRQDAWTQDEDLLLAEVVLRHIRDGGTQLSAFEEVGKKLSRTSAACGFRWNSYVRKQYKSGIELAKKQRKEAKKDTTVLEAPTASKNNSIQEEASVQLPKTIEVSTIRKIISLLEEYEQSQQNHEVLKQENTELREVILSLEEKNKKLLEENGTLANNLEVIEEDYNALIEIMERARKMVVLQEDERSRKVKFQMDRNGNLERIEK
ncbi:RsfA family transcriptional regulator [Cytobacillus suaedae]|nr:RsfA family transcriptional regulator [Cytobacillus suaedae]